jgi:hypothetical protein
MSIINQKHYNLSERKSEFFSSQPFPFLILDDFINIEYFTKLSIVINVEKEKATSGKQFNTEVELKKWISLNSEVPELIKLIIDEMNSREWLDNLKNLTGIDSLVNTKVGNTKLANFHEMNPGGFLGSHVDHAVDPDKSLPHVLNNLFYLSSEWDEKYGGGTELFDRKGKKLLNKIIYKPNRTIIFLHTPYSFHGVERISDDAPMTRKTIYVDYYSTSLEPYKGMKFNFPNHWFYHGTTFPLNSFFDYFKKGNLNYTKAMIRYKLNQFIVK